MLPKEHRPFGGLEFQVSEVVGRLEAGVNSREASNGDPKPEIRKISAGFFEPEATSMEGILKTLEDMVRNSDPTSESNEPPLLPTDLTARAAILSHSVAVLFGRLERSHSGRLGAHIASETTRWLAHMFRYAISGESRLALIAHYFLISKLALVLQLHWVDIPIRIYYFSRLHTCLLVSCVYLYFT